MDHQANVRQLVQKLKTRTDDPSSSVNFAHFLSCFDLTLLPRFDFEILRLHHGFKNLGGSKDAREKLTTSIIISPLTNVSIMITEQPN